MSSPLKSHHSLKLQSQTIPTLKVHSNKWLNTGLALTIVALGFSATGCNTTHEFKPTASVIVGAHKSL